MGMTEMLRTAIRESEMSFMEMERRSGVLRQTIMKFVDGEQSIRLESADKLARMFSIKVIRQDG